MKITQISNTLANQPQRKKEQNAPSFEGAIIRFSNKAVDSNGIYLIRKMGVDNHFVDNVAILEQALQQNRTTTQHTIMAKEGVAGFFDKIIQLIADAKALPDGAVVDGSHLA